jgi:hypothetical protein
LIDAIWGGVTMQRWLENQWFSGAGAAREDEVSGSKTGQRLTGLFVLVLSGGFTAWSWYTALHDGHHRPKTAAVFSFMAVAGLATLLFPIDRERLRAEHGVDSPQTWAHCPLAWKVMLVVALLAGFGNLFASRGSEPATGDRRSCVSAAGQSEGNAPYETQPFAINTLVAHSVDFGRSEIASRPACVRK